jgi:hypothetical protein
MQGVLVFATEAARNSAITSPQEGQFAFTKDTNSLWYYSGSAWVASGATGDIEGVTAGTGISGGGTSGTVTITNSMATTIDAAGDIIYGTGNDAFTKLSIGTAGQVLKVNSGATAPEWGAASASSFVGVALSDSSDQSIPNNTSTAVNFDSEKYDTSGFHDNAVNNSRITIPAGKAGYYLVIAKIDWYNNTTGRRNVQIRKNGTNIASAFLGALINEEVHNQVSTIVNLAVNDYLEIFAYQTSGGSLSLYMTNTVDVDFIAQYLGA